MSEERRRRQQEREQAPKARPARTVVIAVLVVAAFVGVYFVARWRRGQKFDAFAQCLAEKQVKMYGLYWCTHCEEQKEWFGSSFHYVPYVECGIRGSRREEPVCAQAGVVNFPTWQFPDGQRLVGPQPLQVLSEKTGCKLP